MASLDRREVRQLLTNITEEAWQDLDLLTIEDREQAVRDDVERVRSSALLPDVAVVGWVYDVTTGRIREVVGQTAAQS
jgi:carbonic anhydrase